MANRRVLISNSVSILIRQVTQNITALILTIVIARELGAYALGQYSLGFAFYFIFMTIASNGFKILFTREVARQPAQTDLYLVSGSLLQGGAALVSYALLAVTVVLLPYSIDTTEIILLYGLTLIPFALSNTTEAIFQAYNRMHIITLCTVPVYIARIVLMIQIIQAGGTVSDLALIHIVSEIVVLLLEWVFVLFLHRPIRWVIDQRFIDRTLQGARTFVAIESIATFRSRIPVLILSLLVGEAAAGIYSAAMQLMRPFELITGSIVLGLFPTLSQSHRSNPARLKSLTDRALTILLLVAIPMCVGFYFIGSDVLVLLYDDPVFREAGDVLFILGLSLLALAIKRPFSYLLIATDFERRNLDIVLFSTISGLILGFILTDRYQLMGAAVAFSAVEIAVAILFGYYVMRDVYVPNIARILLQALPVSLLMIGVFSVLQDAQIAIIPVLLTAGTIYLITAGLTVIMVADGLQTIRARLTRQRA